MSCFLVDSRVLLWATGDPDRLSTEARRTIGDSENRILVSHGTLWELSIKVTIGKLVLPESYFTELSDQGYELLPTREEHFAVYRRLPMVHRDPFDRLLVAQALAEGLPLISCDPEIAGYQVPVVW